MKELLEVGPDLGQYLNVRDMKYLLPKRAVKVITKANSRMKIQSFALLPDFMAEGGESTRWDVISTGAQMPL